LIRSVVPAVCLTLLSLLVTGCGAPSFLVTPVANANRLQEQQVKSGKGWSPPKVAIIEVEGMLMNAESGGLLQATENPVAKFVQQMDRAAADEDVRAVVLRVNSPGGTVTGSDTMYEVVRRFRERTKKPVVTSTQEVSASGAYYVSLASDRIYAQPTSVVGSIGVIFSVLEFEGTLAKLGVTNNSVKSGTLKDMGSPLKSLDANERAVMQEMVDEYFARFVALVRERRPNLGEPAVSDVKEYRKDGYAGVFSGRVFSGESAKRLGLIDEVGGLEEAIKAAKELAKVPNAAVVMYRRPYGYGGSIYASSPAPQPRADVLRLQIPGLRELPTGFYYLWEPGR
jgi:protease-4